MCVYIFIYVCVYIYIYIYIYIYLYIYIYNDLWDNLSHKCCTVPVTLRVYTFHSPDLFSQTRGPHYIHDQNLIH